MHPRICSISEDWTDEGSLLGQWVSEMWARSDSTPSLCWKEWDHACHVQHWDEVPYKLGTSAILMCAPPTCAHCLCRSASCCLISTCPWRSCCLVSTCPWRSCCLISTCPWRSWAKMLRVWWSDNTSAEWEKISVRDGAARMFKICTTLTLLLPPCCHGCCCIPDLCPQTLQVVVQLHRGQQEQPLDNVKFASMEVFHVATTPSQAVQKWNVHTQTFC